MNIYQQHTKHIFLFVNKFFFVSIFFYTLIYSHTTETAIAEAKSTEHLKNKIDNKKLYNNVYYTLTVDYTFFLKKFNSLDKSFLERLLKKETVNEKNEIVLVNKESYNLRIILQILQTILKQIKNNFSSLINTNKLEEFIDIINQEYAKNKNLLQSFKKAIYVILGNENHYDQTNSINLKSMTFEEKIFKNPTIITILWILYSYEKFSNILSMDGIGNNREIQNEEIFVYSYPIYLHSLHKTFNEIKFDQTLIKYFLPFLTTNEGISYLMNSEKYNKAINENMAYHLIKNQKTQLMELLLDEKNKAHTTKINTIMKKIAAVSHELVLLKQGKAFPNNWLFNLFDVQDLSMQDYFRQYIPEKIFGIGHGFNSDRSSYIIHSAVKFYESALGTTVYKIWQHANQEKANKSTNDAYNPFFTNIITESIFPYASAWPFSKSYNKEKLDKYFANITNIAKINMSVADCHWENKRIYTFPDRIEQYRNMPGIGGKILNFIPGGAAIVGGAIHLMATGMAIRAQYFSIKSLLSQYKNIKNHYKYFFCLKKLILYSKQLTNALTKLYEENNVDPESMLPEIIQMKNILNNKTKDGLMNKILSWSNKKINLWANTIYNFFAPGRMAYFYFKELYESIEIDILNNYIGAIDIVLAKLKLLELKKQHADISFSIPILLQPEDNLQAQLKAKNMWYPSLRGLPIKNSLFLEKNQKNMMLVSPVAGGKTVLLSTILTQLYLANMAIVAADELEYTYFTNIVDHMRHDYDIGSGISQHLAERKSMQAVKNIAANQRDTEKSIIIIDEIYKGTIPQLAVKEALIDLPPILKKNNIITIVTTHFPEITKITQNKELFTELYYLAVDHVGGVFNRTHKLFKDDEYNWWIRDEELGLKYQLAQDSE